MMVFIMFVNNPKQKFDYSMTQVFYMSGKNIPCEKDGGIEGNSGVYSKETKVYNKEKCNSPIFRHTNSITSYTCAKYRNITFSLIVIPLFPCFLHHYRLQILYTTIFLIERMFLVTCFIHMSVTQRTYSTIEVVQKSRSQTIHCCLQPQYNRSHCLVLRRFGHILFPILVL